MSPAIETQQDRIKRRLWELALFQYGDLGHRGDLAMRTDAYWLAIEAITRNPPLIDPGTAREDVSLLSDGTILFEFWINQDKPGRVGRLLRLRLVDGKTIITNRSLPDGSSIEGIVRHNLYGLVEPARGEIAALFEWLHRGDT